MYTQYQQDHDRKYSEAQIKAAFREIDMFGYQAMDKQLQKVIDWLDSDSVGLYPNYKG